MLVHYITVKNIIYYIFYQKYKQCLWLFLLHLPHFHCIFLYLIQFIFSAHKNQKYLDFVDCFQIVIWFTYWFQIVNGCWRRIFAIKCIYVNCIDSFYSQMNAVTKVPWMFVSISLCVSVLFVHYKSRKIVQPRFSSKFHVSLIRPFLFFSYVFFVFIFWLNSTIFLVQYEYLISSSDLIHTRNSIEVYFDFI